MMRVAIFDFDGTLYKDETFQLMMDHFKHHPKYQHRYGAFFRKILPRYISYKLKVYPETRMKERSMQLYLSGLGELSYDDMQTYFKEIAEKAREGFNQRVVETLKTHNENNVYTMLVSGAYTPLLQTVTDDLHFDEIIGTDIPFTDKKIDTSKKIHHVQGERKNERIHHILNGKDIDWKNSYAYGDSYSDLSVLELVGNPVAVHPDDRLAAIAKERNWKVLS